MTLEADDARRVRRGRSSDPAERRATRILEQMGDALMLMDSEFRIIDVNPAAERILGTRRDSLVGLTHWKAFPGSVGAEPERAYRQVLDERVEAHFTHHYLDAGLDFHAEIDAYPTDDGGLAVFWRDVTARVEAVAALRASEAQYRTLFESIDEGFCVIEVIFDEHDRPVDYRFVETNPAFVRHTGLANAVGRRMRALAPSHEEHWFETYGRVALSGTPVRFQNRADALDRWFDVYAFRIGEPNERKVAVLFSDLTAAHAVEHERERLLAAERAALADAEAARHTAERARREADEANKAKSAFLATMSHEIRTPINAIVGYAQLIELGVAGPVTVQQQDYLARLAATSEHLRGLVDDVLDLAKIDAAGMTVAREFGLTGALVAAALDLVRPQASAKGVRLVDRRPGEPGEPFVGDEHRVRQILANLLSNAVKFTEPGGVVTIDCGMADNTPIATELRGAGPWTFVRVEDTGVGIPPEEQARVFDPFHQVERGHTRRQGGTGLGLAISRRLARLMGGDLTLESALGVGSTFSLWLPAVSATQDARETAADRGARARQEPGAGRVHGLAEVGMYLRERVEDVIAAYAARLRADPAFPQAVHLRRSELEDHQLSFLVDVAQTLVVVEETGGPESDLLRDGSTIQRVVAELHGSMRHRRGWTESLLVREYEILREEIGAVVRRRVPEGAGDVSLALEVLDRLVDRAAAIGQAALRRAAESEEGRDG
jgi:PAS domain S-box-containing protein